MPSAADHAGGKESTPYCRECADASGNLHPYERVLEGLVSREYMGKNGMDRNAAETAAKNALAHQPAWKR